MKNSPSFSQWSKGPLCLAHAKTSVKTFAFVAICFLGFFMPTIGQAQVWVDDLILRPVSTESSSEEVAEVLPFAKREMLQIDDAYTQPSPVMRQVVSEAKGEIEVRSLQGELVWQKRGISENELRWALPSLEDGIYIVIVRSAQGMSHKTIAIRND